MKERREMKVVNEQQEKESKWMICVPIFVMMLGAWIMWSMYIHIEDRCHYEKIYLENDKTRVDLLFMAWIKLTDNPKKLTFEEWKTLREAGLLKQDK